MRSRHTSILLVDHHIEPNSDWLEKLNCRKEDFVILDPETIFSEIDWTQYEEDVRVINKIYSRLFEDVVMNNKALICFWPLNQQFGSDWFELASLCKVNSYKIEIDNCLSFDEVNCGFDERILTSWKKFVYFLIESLFEDIQLNEEFDEIATLKSDNETIILFKIERGGKTRYSYSFDSGFLELGLDSTGDSDRMDNAFQSFDSFHEMLEKLHKMNDLSLFESHFGDISLEKAYFNTLSRKFKTTNLIENWIKNYSMN